MTFLVIYLIGVVLTYTIDRLVAIIDTEGNTVGDKVARLVISLMSWFVLVCFGVAWVFSHLNKLIPHKYFEQEAPKWIRWF